MNQHSSSKQKYYRPLIGAALVAASLFQFSFPVFAAGTAAGEVLRNTATGSYEDDAGNPYTIESNTVDVTVAKIAGITNQPAGITDETTSATNTSVLTGDRVSFEFEVTNVGNDISNIFIPTLGNITTQGLNRNTAVSANDNENFVIQVSPALNADGTIAGGGGAFAFTDIPPTGTASEPRPANGIVADVPINGKVLVKVTGTVTATAAGAPIEVLLGNTGPNTDPNAPVAATQNQPDTDGGETGGEGNDVRTENSTAATVIGDPVGDGQKEASALQQVFLGSNPLAMTRIEKTRGDVQDGATADLDDNIIPYSLELEVLNTTANSLYTPGDLEGRDFDGRITGIAAADDGNLILISDAIPANTTLNAAIAPVGDWTPIYTTDTAGTPDTMNWTTTAPTTPAEFTAVTRVGWVYDARTGAPGDGPIPAGTIVTSADGGFTFEVITSGLNPTTGGTVANIAQVFGTTDDGDPATLIGVEVFDESGDQNPSNFNANGSLGPNEDAPQSTGIADPATHGVDSENNNNANGADPASPGGEDSVITIGAPGALINGPGGQPAATGNVFGVGPDNDHDFQNKGVDNFGDIVDPQHNAGNTFDPNVVSFTNTLSNPGTTDLSNVLLQPINPEFEAGFSGADVTDEDLPIGTTVKLTLGGQEATYTYQDNAATGDTTDRLFVLTSGTPIIIPTLAAGVPLDYTVEVDLPSNTGLSTDDAVNGGFPVPIIAFQDNVATDGSPNAGENRNLTVNQVYTGHIKVSKQVAVIDTTGTAATNPNFGTVRAGMGFDDSDGNKDPLPGDTLEYRVIYRNISEPQVGTGNNLVLNGVDVKIDEDGTLDAIDGGGLDASGNNWGLDNNTDGDIDTINVQNSASDTNSGTINFFTGEVTVNTPLGTGMVPAGTTDPGDTVTGYRVTVPLLAPVGAEAPAQLDVYNPGNGDSAFTFQRKVDQFDGLAQEGLD